MADSPKAAPADNAASASIPKSQNANYGGLLNPLFLASFCLLEKNIDANNGTVYFTQKLDTIVSALVTEASSELSSHYSSPFEASNPEARLPTIMGMIQSGQAIANIGMFAGITGSEFIKGKADILAAEFEKLDGKSNFTKVNSVQIYISSEPVKISLTLLFQAWEDAATEVEEPLTLLQSWALPIKLSNLSILSSVAKSVSDGKSVIAGLFPSDAPPFIALTYGGKTYSPLLIESISDPLKVERDRNGNRLAAEVTITLCSRTAIDAGDWSGSSPNSFRSG